MNTELEALEAKIEQVVALVHQLRAENEVLKNPASYTHLRAHETVLDLVCRLLLEKKQSIQEVLVKQITNSRPASREN